MVLAEAKLERTDSPYAEPRLVPLLLHGCRHQCDEMMSVLQDEKRNPDATDGGRWWRSLRLMEGECRQIPEWLKTLAWTVENWVERAD